ncbi:MAG: DDE-type integrase/transposase/recombinase, partial [Ensifer adhaerens]
RCLHIGGCCTGQRLDGRSRMSGDAHVRICESLGVKFPRATRLAVRINGRKGCLWRAVDQDGYVLDEIAPVRRNTRAASRLLTRLMKKQGIVPRRMITDKLRSYEAARRQVMPGVEHRSHKGLNNRAENSHLPFRKRERMRQGFRSIGSLQHFVSLFSAVRNLFVPGHTKPSANQIRNHRLQAMAQWKTVSGQIV